MSAPTSHDPLVVTTEHAGSWWRRAYASDGHGLYARAESTELCPELLTVRELAEFGLRGMADCLPMPTGPEPRDIQVRVTDLLVERHSTNESLSEAAEALRACRDRIAELEARVAEREQGADEYPPAMPWAQLMDHEDLTEFLDELAASAITHASSETALAEVEATCGRWRAIAEAQHGHNTAPGPDAMTRTFAPTQALREGEHYAVTHHDYRVPRDLPEPGGA